MCARVGRLLLISPAIKMSPQGKCVLTHQTNIPDLFLLSSQEIIKTTYNKTKYSELTFLKKGDIFTPFLLHLI